MELSFMGVNASKATSPDPFVWLCSVSLPISVFFTHSPHDVLARTRDSSITPRPYSLCPKVSNTNGKLLSPNYLRSLPAAPHSDLSARQYKGLFQDMMFERLRDSTFSEDASEVIVQPLYLWTWSCFTLYFHRCIGIFINWKVCLYSTCAWRKG